jgi:hypothetical protein
MVVSLTVNLFAYFINRQKAANLYRKVAKKEHHCRFAVLPFCRFLFVISYCSARARARAALNRWSWG